MHITDATAYVAGNPWKTWLFVPLAIDQRGLYGMAKGTSNAFAPRREGRKRQADPAAASPPSTGRDRP